MVYCGKASQGCQNCRIRRIKCDKVRPECSQCVRVAKKCPGYRDQLSLMFRDESSKVIQKAHAQWGVEQGESSGAASAATASPAAHSSSSSRSARLSARSTDSGSTPSPATGSPRTPPPAQSTTVSIKAPSSRKGSPVDWQPPPEEQAALAVVSQKPIPRTVNPADVEQGVSFYIKHFVIGQPDEPRTPGEVQDARWIGDPLVQDVMAAIGLVGMSNLRGDESMNSLARQKYGMALQRTARSIQDINSIDMVVAMKSVVMLALFEVVRGTHDATGSAKAHIMGAAALIRSFLPNLDSPKAATGGFRGLLQLCYSLFIPCHNAGVALPATFFDWIAVSGEVVATSNPQDRAATDLVVVISRYVHLTAFVRAHAFIDGRPKTTSVIRQALMLDGELDSWESRQEGKWLFGVSPDANLPLEAAFRGQCHTYTDMWVARVWNHYRWARIMVNQMILDFVHRYPASSLAIVSAAQQSRCLATMSRLAEDVLVSIPTHYRHPLLNDEQRRMLERTSGGAGVGAAGVPSMLHQLKVAACAPGVPHEFWAWGLNVLDTVWADLGMLQAKSLAEVMRAHHDKLKIQMPEGILKRGPHFKREVSP